MKFRCGPLVYRTIIDWGFAKPDGIRIIDHINHLEIGGDCVKKKNFPKWLKDNELKLNKDSFSDFDITALHNFILILCCNKIDQTVGGKGYDEIMKDPHSVESLLKKIRAFRNDMSHEYAETVNDSHIDEMMVTMRECIIAAGKLYGKDQNEIDSKVKLLNDEFDKVILDSTHLYENRMVYIGKLIETEVPAMLLERYSQYFFVPLQGSFKRRDTPKNFQCCKLTVTNGDRRGESTDNKNGFPCTEIFNKTKEKFVVINGGPRSGKTTLMQNMYKNILDTSVNESKPKYGNIEQFKIPIYVECRSEQQTSIAKFIREYLKDFSSSEDDIIEAFKIVKGLVFLIDGYDEITNNGRQLVESIVDFCRDNNASCIVSFRVDAGNNFVSELKRKALSYTKMFILPISEMSDQVNFLMSYAGKMDGSIDTDKLVKSFDEIPAAARNVFSSPTLLPLFISLFINDPDSVPKMKNEQSVFETVRTYFLREMATKLELEKVHNPEGISKEVANVLGKFCLKFFGAKKNFLDQIDYSMMVAECDKIEGMSKKVDIASLLSCILTQEHSFKYTQDKYYRFLHSTIQEFFAAKYVSEIIGELQDDRSSQNQLRSSFLSGVLKTIEKRYKRSQSEDRQLLEFLQVLELDDSQSDIRKEMKRYGNIIKFLILEILANGELSKYSNTFTLLFKKYYEPWNDSTVYHLDLIMSSNSNSEIISFVSVCLRGWYRYKLEYYRHIKPMTDVVQIMKTGVFITFDSTEITNSRQIIKLMTALGEDSKIKLHLCHSFNNYQPLEEEFYTQLKNSKCKLIEFIGCISSREHLSIVVKAFRGNKYDNLYISTPSVSDISFVALEEHKGMLHLMTKYSEDFSSTGSNPVRGKTMLTIEYIPADGENQLFHLLKHICPKSKKFSWILLDYCHLTDTDSNDLLKKLYGEKIRTVERFWGGSSSEVKKWSVRQDKSRELQLHLPMSKEEIEEEEEERKKKTPKCQGKIFRCFFNKI